MCRERKPTHIESFKKYLNDKDGFFSWESSIFSKTKAEFAIVSSPIWAGVLLRSKEFVPTNELTYLDYGYIGMLNGIELYCAGLLNHNLHMPDCTFVRGSHA